ncbi:hypothetical protein AURANDRAFT_62864 [Aureococcus anophagefferens]|uniref:AAA+ ATPase domain-containing protein n=1 Tax=Aureococcus anophagefferens TaxID=44056 RepID=F0Y3C5_AURAN|nr:hypothetical protein AURANDRAFT_62864 [Aureococcus anophagefferens]EGB10271.1 hypothetical protein AURANDRAFT_62864 [Aureococcus anophagefferens]|eukprot:XP_009035083.1 hypothetical protein AURANDRAFT_62864 [Aureococcus anophagefferens]
MPKRKKRKDGDEDEALLGGAERARRAARRGGGGGGGKRRAKAPPADLKHWVLRWPLDDVAAPAAESRSRLGLAPVAPLPETWPTVAAYTASFRPGVYEEARAAMAQALRAGGERPCAAALEVAGLGDARPGSLVALRRGRDAVATAGRVVAETAPGTRAVSVLAASLWFCDAWDDLVGDGWRCRDAGASLPAERVDAALARRHWPRFLDGLVTGRAATHVRFADDDGGGGGAFGGDELADDIEDAFVTRDGFAVEEDEEARAVEEEEEGARAVEDDAVAAAAAAAAAALNESQARALAAVDDGAVAVVQGPPGTGKTTFVAAAVLRLAARGYRVLVAAPSNRAVTVTFDRVLRGCPALDAALVGVRASLVDDEAAPAARAARFAYTVGDAFAARVRAGDEDPGWLRRVAPRWCAAHDVHDDAVRRARGADLAREFVEGSRVVFATLGTCGSSLVRRSGAFDVAVVDEAAQSVEAETLACLQNLAWSGRLLLVGDQCQLPATVVSPLAVRAGFDRSMLSRLAAARRGAWPEPAMLEIQYRMDPAIAAFPSGRWYGGRLRTGARPGDGDVAAAAARALGLASGARRALVDVASGAERRDGAALANPREAALVAAAGRAAAATGASVAVLTFYAGQRALLAAALAGSGCRVSTVDAAQGSEADVVLVSCVRANAEGRRGFLGDFRRLNVAITRARSLLLCFGDAATLGGGDDDLGALVADFDRAGDVVAEAAVAAAVRPGAAATARRDLERREAALKRELARLRAGPRTPPDRPQLPVPRPETGFYLDYAPAAS